MVESGLVAVGSHTRHHVRMRDNLSIEQMQEEIVASRDDIEKNCGQPVELFCFPNGDRTPESAKLVEQSYLGACLTENGWNSKVTPAHSIRRVALHQDRSATPNAFIARLAGAL